MINRRPEGSEPMALQPSGPVEERRAVRSGRLAVGSLACPQCDAPVAPDRPLSPADPLTCPFCAHPGAVRDFLSIGEPTRPARVVVTVVDRKLRVLARSRPSRPPRSDR